MPIVESANGIPASAAAAAPARSPSVCIIRVKPVGAIPNGSADAAAEDLHARVDRRDVAQDRRVELDVRERLAGAGERDLALGRPSV